MGVVKHHNELRIELGSVYGWLSADLQLAIMAQEYNEPSAAGDFVLHNKCKTTVLLQMPSVR